MKEIDEVAEELLTKIMEAADRNAPKIKYRRLPHPEIDNELKDLMKKLCRIKVLLANQIKYVNKKRLNVLREEIRIKWGIKQDEMWRNPILKTDLGKKIHQNSGKK